MLTPRRLARFVGTVVLLGWMWISAGCTPASPTATPTPTAAPLVEIARHFADNRDLIAARAALAGLALEDAPAAVTALAQQEAAAGHADDSRALAALAAALLATPTGPEASTERPVVVDTEAPTRTARLTETPAAVGFELVSRERVCDRKVGSALLEVFTQDAGGGQIGGFEIQVIWNGGADRFFTGLKPDIGPGYGDFQMEPGVSYRVRLAAWPDVAADDVISEACATETTSYPGGVRLVFRRLAP